MPFRETCRMEERIRMLSDYDRGIWSVSDLCRRYGVSRDTFYEWRRRRESGESDWFMDRSHAPLRRPHATAAELKHEIIALRRRFPHMGPRKLLALLARRAPEISWPAASTIGDILQRAGLVTPVKRRRRALEQGRPFAAVVAANDEWSADFKGWFRTGDRQRTDPLTLSDSYSRFLIDIRIVLPTMEGAQPVFAAAFQAYGLPQAIRCDNGPPFGSRAAAGLTRLSAWWAKLGIEPHFIEVASPQENGRHERMHRTLKEQTLRPPARQAPDQQARFDGFRAHYNEERPHEALGQRFPAELYQRSPRRLPAQIEDPEYDADHVLRWVRTDGGIKWRGKHVFISEALVGELVGVLELESGDYLVRFCQLNLGVIDRFGRFSRFAPRRYRLREPAEPTEPAAPNLSGILPVQSVDHQPG